MNNFNFRNQRLLQDFLQPQTETRPIKVLVHDFIQSVIFTPFPQDYELQLERLRLAGKIYESIGFKRKAAFYMRFAALKSVSVEPNWQLCYDDLLLSLEGFGLSLDPAKYEYSLYDQNASIWPGLHFQLLEELITCCKRIQSVQSGTLAIRHMSFMLHSLESYLSDQRKCECATDLDEISQKFGEDSPVSLKLSNGFTVPNVNLTKYPTCIRLEPLNLPLPLRPQRLYKPSSKAPNISNPFIFTPINSKSTVGLDDQEKTNIIWTQNEHCSTILVFRNPLPFELKISSIQLLTDGLPFEGKPRCLNLEANDEDTTIHLFGIPRKSVTDDNRSATEKEDVTKTKSLTKQTNQIEIFGYTTHVLGVKSNCKFDDLPLYKRKRRFPKNYIVEVSPVLPRMLIDVQGCADGDLSVTQIPLDEVRDDFVITTCILSRSFVELMIQIIITNSPESHADLSYISTKSIKENQLIESEEDIDIVEGLPLQPSENFKLSIKINRELFKDKQQIVITFSYSSREAYQEKFCRKAALKLCLQDHIDADSVLEVLPEVTI